jgi:hypothetical protein
MRGEASCAYPRNCKSISKRYTSPTLPILTLPRHSTAGLAPYSLIIEFLPRHPDQREAGDIPHPPQGTPDVRELAGLDQYIRKGVPDARQRVGQGQAIDRCIRHARVQRHELHICELCIPPPAIMGYIPCCRRRGGSSRPHSHVRSPICGEGN